MQAVTVTHRTRGRFAGAGRRAALRLGAALLAGACIAAAPGCRTAKATNNARMKQQDLKDRGVQRVDMAQEMQAQGALDDALTYFALALEDNPTLVTAYIGMGEIYRIKNNNLAAAQAFGKSAEIAPGNFDAQYGHGLALQLLEKFTEAVRAYLRALAIEPDDFRANLNLATAYFQLKEGRQALPYARKAVEVNPLDGPARVNLGAVYAALDWHNEAVRQYQAAAELMELTPPLLLNLATSLGKSERYQEMANTLDRLIEIEPSAQAWERLGFARFRLRQYEDAVAAFQASLEIDPEHYPALNGVGICMLNKYLLSERTDIEARREAITALRKSLQLNPSQPRIVDLLSRYD
jgi:tetratricopeptide (TPR) repeat protein